MSEKMTLTQRKRVAILAAAKEEFKESGFQNTSMDRIAARAEVSKRTLYNHFSSKEALFSVIAQSLVTQIQQAMEFPFDENQAIDQQLRSIAHQELQLLSDSDFMDTSRMLMAEALRAPEIAQDMMTRMSQTESGLSRWMRKASAHGLAIEDPDFAAEQFIGMIKSFAFWPQLLKGQPFPDKAAQERIADEVVMMILRRYQTEQ
ncbi:hypothetical protein BTA51_03625 [Hahella sp. CCB-MM4]|uniref:TetR/AcrR family transcriptional regulator n=1 Tax=Hahella sp. (strain CCB-MM4) TaxID=1926491 RepID=UPI000B9C1CB9|nr:TetR/AcrR family transcriptional regulator [Hahella sp. CCB-MM4]OZG74125.1 hypothetical protein BTA51_03625 [Hahella sp. CCB-MM4]